MKAIVVDDSMVMRKVLIGVLGKVGITEVVQAKNGKEAVEAVMKEEFCVMLLDWNMPEMDGLTCLKTIRAMGKKLPVIMCTTETEKIRVIEALQAGANDYIIKPFNAEVIGGKIKKLVQIAPAAPQA